VFNIKKFSKKVFLTPHSREIVFGKNIWDVLFSQKIFAFRKIFLSGEAKFFSLPPNQISPGTPLPSGLLGHAQWILLDGTPS
jgi:hypothetical protein